MGSAEALGGLVQDRLYHPIQIVGDVAVPESQDCPPIVHQEQGSTFIICQRIQMLRSIEFNGQLRRTTCEIDNIWADHQLTCEARAIARYSAPDLSFSFGLTVAESASIGGQMFGDAAHCSASLARLATLAYPPPTPPFQGGEVLSHGNNRTPAAPPPSKRRVLSASPPARRFLRPWRCRSASGAPSSARGRCPALRPVN